MKPYFNKKRIQLNSIIFNQQDFLLLNLSFLDVVDIKDMTIFVDGQKSNYNFYQLDDDKNYEIELSVLEDAKEIQVKVKEEVFIEIHTSKMKRKLWKVKKGLSTKGSKLKRMIHSFYKAIVFFWQEYKLLVTPKILKRYWKEFKTKHFDQRVFYNPRNQKEYLTWLSLQKEIQYDEKIDCALILIAEEEVDCSLYTMFSRVEVVSKLDYSSIREYIQTWEQKYLCILPYGIQVSPFKIEKKGDVIYFDDDCIDVFSKRKCPNFKQEFSLETLMSYNYIGYSILFRKNVLENKNVSTLQEYIISMLYELRKSKIEYQNNCIFHYPQEVIKVMQSENIKDMLEKLIQAKVYKDEDQPTYHYSELIEEKKISILIPTRDNAKILENCLYSITTNTEYSNYEIIVIDNESVEKETFVVFDKYQKILKDKFKVTDAKIPFNYSRINNIGVSYAEGEFLVFLNNDTQIISKRWLKDLLKYASKKHIGAVGAKLLYEDGTVQHAGVFLGQGDVARHVLLNEENKRNRYDYRLSVPYNYSAVTAACMMIEKRKFLEVGGFDEELKVAYNDIDLCLRLLSLSYQQVCNCEVEIFHLESKSRGYNRSVTQIELYNQECSMMWERWRKYLEKDRFYNSKLSKEKEFLLEVTNE